ncbi:MAG TPA: cbb3-type cytochrome oxidase assembly protein CcoS [Gammaproteobacteria bacterium]|nr:cbb3-type cytochrome oxidase assembly protein CcoS [Gammaproteobacteria bacterium]
MNIIYLLIVISLVLIASILGVFFWAIKSGQYDDLDKSGYDILMDDDDPGEPGQTTSGASERHAGNDVDENVTEELERQ